MNITRTDIINLIINKYGFKSYLEIGVRVPAENFDKINIKNKYSVDPDPKGRCDFIMTSDEYFDKYVGNNKFDLVFVDGLHTQKQAYVDVINSMNHLNDDGFIVMHDCNPPTEYHIRSYEEYLKTRGQWNGTVFRAFIELKNKFSDWKFVVIDEDFGCGVLTKKNINIDNNNERYVLDIDWKYFHENRKELLNLITFNEFKLLLQ